MLTSRKSDKAVSSPAHLFKMLNPAYICMLSVDDLADTHRNEVAFMFERGANACAIQDDDCPCMMQATGV